MGNISKIPKIYGLNEVSRILGIPMGTLYNMKWKVCYLVSKLVKE